jgi:hypothetical protein
LSLLALNSSNADIKPSTACETAAWSFILLLSALGGGVDPVHQRLRFGGVGIVLIRGSCFEAVRNDSAGNRLRNAWNRSVKVCGATSARSARTWQRG